MDQPAAVVLVVFGAGLRKTFDGYALSPASVARVQTAADHVALSRPATKPLIGPWPTSWSSSVPRSSPFAAPSAAKTQPPSFRIDGIPGRTGH